MTTSQRVRDVISRLRGTCDLLRWDAEHPTHKEHAWLISYDAEQLLWHALMDMESIIDLMVEDDEDEDNYYPEEIEKFARRITDKLRARRIARKLENVEGRTPEEAQAFLDAAARMREKG